MDGSKTKSAVALTRTGFRAHPTRAYMTDFPAGGIPAARHPVGKSCAFRILLPGEATTISKLLKAANRHASQTRRLLTLSRNNTPHTVTNAHISVAPARSFSAGMRNDSATDKIEVSRDF